MKHKHHHMATRQENEKLPGGYRSWSLFLVCNPSWNVENGERGILELHRQYTAFGDAIGAKHLAVWFTRTLGDEADHESAAKDTDFERSSAYCEKYKLLPSESPHVLVTTRYPDDPDPGDRFVVKLNGLDAPRMGDVLTKLTDQLVVTGLNQGGLDDSVRWRRVLSALSSAISAAGCFFNKVSFSIKSGPVNADIEHSGKGC
jgi:hypothetical protein